MCKYLIVSENEMDICEYTKKPCTLCVLGNGNTYKEAQEKEQKEGKARTRNERA